MPTDAPDFDVESYLTEVRGRMSKENDFVSISEAEQSAAAAEMLGLLDAHKVSRPLTAGIMLSMAWTEAVSEYVNRQ